VKRSLLVLASGFLFAIGLGVSEMTRPEKVIGFLDVFGHWDPSLAFVMGGAVAVYAVAYRFSQRWEAPKFAPRFRVPNNRTIDRRLLGGAALFGAGWGLAGFCPGPGIVAAAAGVTPALYFLPSLLVGMFLHRWLLE
jgi:uncharacterized protein